MKLKRFLFFLAAAALFGTLGPQSQALAALADLGPPVVPHGYPAFYQDGASRMYELCLDPPVDPVVGGPCIFDPPDPASDWSVQSGFGAEAFFWSADANTRPLVAGGRALLVLAVEAAYGGAGDPANGEQMVFGRVRVRFDAPGPGHYKITHPYGTIDLPEAFVADSLATFKDVRLTSDIGASNFLEPAAAFSGALRAFDSDPGAANPMVSLLTWPDFQLDPTLKRVDPTTGAVLAQYVGDGVTPHVVTGSPTGNNIFRIERQDPATGQFRTVSETNLFIVAGKIHVPPAAYDVFTAYPPPPPQSMFAVGPVNRDEVFPAAGSELPHPGGPAAIPEFPGPAVEDPPQGDGFPIGYPYWYQERVTAEDPANPGIFIEQGGLKLAHCPGSDPMCVSVPVDPADPASAALNVGDESFYWTGVADLDARTATNRVDARLVLALEGAFAGATGGPSDGDQVVFARVRLRFTARLPGEYTFTHPYGTLTFNLTEEDLEDDVRFTEDIGIFNPGVTPDADFKGALFGKINPFLTVPDFDNPAVHPELQRTVTLPDGVSTAVIQYVGSPLFRGPVVGSPTGNNIFRVQGPGGLDVTQTEFTVSGKVYDPATFALRPPAGAPVAVNDLAITNPGLPVTIPVTANDTAGASAITTVTLGGLGLGPFDGTAVVSGTSITYTPAAGFTGIDTFAYSATNAQGTSNLATVTVSVLVVETIAVTRAELELRRGQWNIQGTDSIPGSVLTIHAGPTVGGAVIGSAVVQADGRWQFRGRSTTATKITSISLESSTGNVLLNQPMRVR